MPSLFRKKTQTVAPLADADEVRSFLPASARQLGAARLETAFAPDADEDGAADMAFLESLVESIERPPSAAPPADSAATAETVAAPRTTADGALNLFREVSVDNYERRPALFAAVREVEIDDLLEELAVTAAALRSRKAA